MTEEAGRLPLSLAEALQAFGSDGRWESLTDEHREAALGWLSQEPDQVSRRARLVALRVGNGLSLTPADMDRHWSSWEFDRRQADLNAQRPRRAARRRNIHPMTAEMDEHPEAQRTWLELHADERLALLAYVNQPSRSRGRSSRAREVRHALTLGADGTRRWLTFFSTPDARALLQKALWGPVDPAQLPLPHEHRRQPRPPPNEANDALPRHDSAGYRVELEALAERPERPRWFVVLVNLVIGWTLDRPDYLYRVKVVTGRWDRAVYVGDWTYLHDKAVAEAGELRQLVHDHQGIELEEELASRRLKQG